MFTLSYPTALMSAVSLTVAVFFSTTLNAADSSLFSLESGLSNLVYQLSRSVVTIEADKSDLPGIGSAPTRDKTLVSSGIVVDTNGHILVSADMVAEYDQFKVIFENRYLTARLVGTDFFHEIALLQTAERLGQPVRLSTGQSCAGRMVVALANSYGVRATPSLGFCAGARPDGSLQFTVPLMSGATGGGIFDLNGALVGMITGALGRSDQVMVAIPAHRLPAIADYLIIHGDRLAGYIGVTTTDIEISPPLELTSPNTLVSMRAPSRGALSRGTIISSVMPNSPAQRAGLRSGDILFAVDNDPVGSSLELSTFVRLHNPGKVLNLNVIRSATRLTIPVVVGLKPLRRANSAATYATMHQGDNALTPDSLGRVIQHLLNEIVRLEKRIQSAR